MPFGSSALGRGPGRDGIERLRGPGHDFRLSARSALAVGDTRFSRRARGALIRVLQGTEGFTHDWALLTAMGDLGVLIDRQRPGRSGLGSRALADAHHRFERHEASR